ncbi:MAG TPA: flagellar export chaperone FliS [Candidatus Elarobacter sp.]|jgi:flagellar protein FliS|nr:flagellar export chaperone FliS [Candidatus Elarobacter sp.]
MAHTNANLRYLEASINSASPEELVIKVYDALLLFARQALDVMEARPKDIQARHDLLRRAQRACALLMGSLRFDIDSDIPGNLFRIYEFWHHQLVAANMQGDPQKVRDLLPMISGMRETWVEAIRRYRTEAAERVELSALVG